MDAMEATKTNILTERAVLIRPSITMWRGEITDHSASKEVARTAQADEKAVRTSKYLIPKSSLDPIISAAGSLRTWVRQETLPWRWDGVSLLPTDAYFHFAQGWQERRITFDGAVAILLRDWLKHVAEGRTRLGRLYRDYEYPTHAMVATQFSAKIEVFPVPAAEDFRANIAESEAEQIKEELRANAEQQLIQVQSYLWEQMAECVNHIAERLTSYGRDPTSGKIVGKFHDTLVSNLRDLVDRLGRLNITHDPNIENMRQRLKANLCPYDPDDLRQDEKLRESVRDEAARIYTDMAAIYGGLKKAA